MKEDSVINSGKMCTYGYREDPVEKGKIDTIGGRREKCWSDFLKYRRGDGRWNVSGRGGLTQE